MGVGKLARRRIYRGRGSRGVETPLQEVDFSTLLRLGGGLSVLLLGFGLLLGDCARHGKDELRVLAGCCDDAFICLFRDSRADRVRVRYVTEAPEGFDLLGWETSDLFHIDERIEGFNAVGRGGV